MINQRLGTRLTARLRTAALLALLAAVLLMSASAVLAATTIPGTWAAFGSAGFASASEVSVAVASDGTVGVAYTSGTSVLYRTNSGGGWSAAETVATSLGNLDVHLVYAGTIPYVSWANQTVSAPFPSSRPYMAYKPAGSWVGLGGSNSGNGVCAFCTNDWLVEATDIAIDTTTGRPGMVFAGYDQVSFAAGDTYFVEWNGSAWVDAAGGAPSASGTAGVLAGFANAFGIGMWPSLAYNNAGTPFIALTEIYDDNGNFLADPGEEEVVAATYSGSWSLTRLTVAGGNDGFPEIQFNGAEGMLVYTDVTNRDGFYSRYTGSWSAPAAITGATDASRAELTVGVVGFVTVLTNGAPTSNVTARLFNGVDWDDLGTGALVENSTTVANTPSIGLDPNGIPFAAYRSSSGTISVERFAPTPANVTINDVSLTEGNAGVTNLTFTVTRDSNIWHVPISYATANNTAAQPVDYASASGNLIFPIRGTLTQTFNVPVNGDTLYEANETFFANLTTTSIAANITDAQGLGTITNDDPPPVISIGSPSAITEGTGGTVTLSFPLSLDVVSGLPASVTVNTTNGTAIAPGDFTAISGGTGTVPAGSLTGTVDVTIISDALDEEDTESFTVTISAPVDAVLGATTVATGTINDDDPPPNISINDVTVVEGNAGTINASFTVSLDAPSGRTVTVDYTTADGTALQPGDYASTSGTLTFVAGDVSETVTVTVSGDTLDEADETYFVNLSNAVNGTITDAQGTGAITDDDLPPMISIGTPSAINEGNAGTATLSFPVTLSAISGLDISATVNTANGTATAGAGADYIAISGGTVSILAGANSGTVDVTINGDTLFEANEDFTVTLSALVNASPGTLIATGTITNDDAAPVVTIGDPAAAIVEGNAGTVNAVFPLSLNVIGGLDVTVTYNTADGTATAPGDYAAAVAQTATITAGSTSGSITVPVNGDLLDEINENFTVTISAPVNATLGATTTGTATITDDDATPSINIGSPSIVEGNAGTVTLSFPVTLTAVSGQAVSATVNTADGTATSPSDYAAIVGGSVNIPAGSPGTTIDVTVNGDTLFEINETFTVTLSAPVNAALGTAVGTGTITNDDTAPVVSIGDPVAAAVEGDVGTTILSFPLSLNTASGANVTVTVNTTNVTATAPGDYVAIVGGTAAIIAGSTTGSVDVTINGDTLDELDESFTVTISAPVNATLGATTSGNGTITDDDATPSVSIGNASVSEGNAGTVTLSLPVTLSAISGQSISVTVNTTDGSAAAPGDYIAIVGGTLNIPAGNAGGTVDVTVNGDTTFEANEDFTVTISAPVNATLGTATATGTINNDDGVPLISIGNPVAAVTEGDAGTVTLTFPLTLSAISGQNVSVTYNTADVTATAPGDYTAVVGGTASIIAGSTTGSIDITVNGDTLDEANETFTVTLSNPVNAGLGATTVGTGTIADDDTATLSISTPAAVTEGNAGTVNVTFTVTLSTASASVVTVDYATANVTAVEPGDYTSASGTLTFNPGGPLTQDIIVTVNGDLLDENTETFTVTLSNPVNSSITTAVGTGTITDDDNPPNIAIADTSVTEGDAGTVNMVFTVTLDAPSGLPISVDWATADGTAVEPGDYAASNGTVNFAPGDDSETITVTVNGDTLDENDETFVVNLTNAVNAAITDAQATGTITDDDSALLSIGDAAAVVEGDAGTVTATFTVTLSTASASIITVDYATTDGTAVEPGDYASTTGTLTFNPGGPLTQDVTVNVNGDVLDEIDETFTVTLSNPTNSSITDNSGTGTITDDDAAPTVTIADAAPVVEGDSGTVNASFTVSLSAISGQDVTVTYNTADVTAAAPGDYAAAVSQTVTIPAGNISGTLDVAVSGDELDEADETFTVTISAPVNATLGATITAVGTITDDDTADFLVTETDGSTATTEAGAPDTINVSLSAQPLTDVVITAVSANTAEVTVSPASRTFTPANWNTPQAFTVTGIDDAIADGDQIVTITFAVDDPASDDTFDLLPDKTVSVTNADDDTPRVNLSTGAVTVSEAGATGTLVITLGSAPTADVTIGLTLADGAPNGATVVSTTPSLTIPVGTTGPVTVTLGGLNDTVVETLTHIDTLTVSVTSADASYNGAGAVFAGGAGAAFNQVTISITDNDQPGIAISQTLGTTEVSENGGTDTVSVVLNTTPTGDVSVSFTPDAQCELDAGTGFGGASVSRTVIFTPATWNSPQTVSVRAINDVVAESSPHPCSVTISAPVSTDASYNGPAVPITLDGVLITTPGTLPVGVLDNDSSGLSFSPLAVTEGGAAAPYTITLNTPPTSPVTIALAPDAQCVASASPLSIPAGSTTASVLVQAVDDTVVEGLHACLITHTTTSADPIYNGLTLVHTVTINDNDAATSATPAPGAGPTPAPTPITPTTYTLVDGTIVELSTTAIVITRPDGTTQTIEGGRATDFANLLTVFDATGTPVIDLVAIRSRAAGVRTTPPTSTGGLLDVTSSTTIAGRGDAITWTATVTNTTAGPLNDLVVSLVFDAVLDVDATPSTGRIAALGDLRFAKPAFAQSVTTTLTWAIGTLAPGQTATLTLRGTVPTTLAGNSILLTGEVRASNITSVNDSVLVVIVRELPATGETPLWRTALFGGAALLGLAASYVIARRWMGR